MMLITLLICYGILYNEKHVNNLRVSNSGNIMSGDLYVEKRKEESTKDTYGIQVVPINVTATKKKTTTTKK